MNKVRIGVVGIGNMGSAHAWRIHRERLVPDMVLGAVCDSNETRREWAGQKLTDVPVFADAVSMYQSNLIDAVLIAVPHYDHPALAIQAFEHGLHVLVEKPAGVYTKQVLELNRAAAQQPGQVFGIMYNQRTNPVFRKVRDLVQSGELGAIKRAQWTITDWYRPQAYHDSGSWRSIWGGEGGGALINQNPHNLDLFQWILGMPKRIRAFSGFGKYYHIEVEDEVTAYMEFAGGATGVYITSTGEAPGTNRLEIAGEMGKLVVENNTIVFHRNRVSEREFNLSNKAPFGAPECWRCELPVSPDGGEQHIGIMKDFAKSILTGSRLLAPGEEGIHGLMISNAIHFSSWTDSWTDLEQFDHDRFHELLEEKIRASTIEKKSKQTFVEVAGSA